MRKISLAIVCGLLIISALGCGTIKGIGEDISTVGRWLTRGSETAAK